MTNGWSRRDLAPLVAGLATGAPLASLEGVRPPGRLTSSSDGMVLGSGEHQVVANARISGDVMLLPGATISVAADRNLTISGDFVAPVARVFTGAGTVDLNSSRASAARPEWWGAVTDDVSIDSLAALMACLAAHPIMTLRFGDYFISDSWRIARPHCRVEGAGYRGSASGQGTRIVVTSGRTDVIVAGPVEAPRDVNSFLPNVELCNLALARTQPVDAQDGHFPAGLRAHHLLYATFENVSASEHAVGFHVQGLVRSSLRNCIAFRSLNGRQANVPYRGFLLDGTQDIGLAGGNGSIFLIDCNASLGGQPSVVDSVGLLLNGAFADSYVINFEVAGGATGIRVDGMTGLLGARATHGHANLHLRMPIIDQCERTGIELLDTSPQALVELSEPYVACGATAQTGIRCDRLGGATNITGGQILGGFNANHGGSAIGLHASDSVSLLINGLKVADHRRPILLERCRAGSFEGAILNPRVAASAPALVLRDCEGVRVVPFVTGKQAAFPGGCAIEGLARRIDLSLAGMDPAALSDRERTRLLRDGKPVSAARADGVVVNGL